MALHLRDKVVIVTGGGRMHLGISHALRSFGRRHATVTNVAPPRAISERSLLHHEKTEA
jgi:NAD(P)-dependent dehydrogenase (short-subunit alcohol dehydrogenase family)